MRPDADVEPGSLLVAAPSLVDPNFRRTVVYVIDHRGEGTALCLAAMRTGQDLASLEGVVAVHGPVALVDLDADPDTLVPKVRGMRVFAGYSGWSEGQLAGEVERGDWIVVKGLPDDVLTPPGVDLWGRVLRRQGMPTALLATFPTDVRRN
ncbi:YqgE/AlgH family protein [Saccharothrix sp. MB29]|nr:YqgE/AlgH family protein [Saccharothrix sp. MB29]